MEQGEREGTRCSPPGSSFTDRERLRTSGAPTNLPSIGCPTPVESSDASYSPRLHSTFYRLPPPTVHVAASFPSASDVVAVPPHGYDDDDGGKETEFCHRRATPSSSSVLWPLSHAFVHRLANRTHLSLRCC